MVEFDIEDIEGLEFGFSASGWLMIYQLGVAYSLQQHGLSKSKAKFVGASGGAAVSAALALNVDAKLLADFMVRCGSDYHRDPVRKMFQMREYAKACIERCMAADTFNHAALQSGRLNVSVTVLPMMKNVIINKFASNTEYLEACLGSCTATPFAGFPFPLNSEDPDLNGKYVLDGGATNMLPTFSKNTIRVSPLYCLDAEIKPSQYIPLHWGLFPPDVPTLRELFWLGVKDGNTYLTNNGFASFKIPQHVFKEQLAKENTESRIKPLVCREKVSHHSSTLEMTQINPHTHSIPKRELALDKFQVLPDEMNRYQEGVHRVGDSMAVALLMASVKPLALGAVYTELTAKAILSAAHSWVATVENERRKKSEPSGSLLSLRRWVHDEMVDPTNFTIEKAKGYFQTVKEFWLMHVPLVGDKVVPDAPQVIEKVKDHSSTYRFFMRTSLW